MDRATIDSQVHATLKKAKRDLSVPEIAERAGVSLMCASHSLRRLVRAGLAEPNAQIVAADHGARRSTTVVLYRRSGFRVRSAWPAWLTLSALPMACGVRVVRGW